MIRRNRNRLYRFFSLLGALWVSICPAARAGRHERAAEPGEELSTSQAELDEARNKYREAVAQYGAGSREAREARESLRGARHSFHHQRRERTSDSEPTSDTPQDR